MVEHNPDNIRSLLQCLFKYKIPQDRGFLVTRTGIPRSSVYDILVTFEFKKIVEKTKSKKRGRHGRLPIYWTIREGMTEEQAYNILEIDPLRKEI